MDDIKTSQQNNIPAYLEELLKETPSTIAKLNAAWDGLSTETQIKILEEINKGRTGYLEKFKLKALKSKNAYVRYLAAKKLSLSEDSSEEVNAKKLIENDPDPLVKYSLYEDDFFPKLPDGEGFFSLPHSARLAIARSLTRRGEEIAAIIRYAVENCLENGTVTEQELFEILLDYLNRKEFKARYVRDHFRDDRDGYDVYSDGKDIESLWDMVPKVPKSCAYVLINYLPASAGFSDDIPKKIADSLDKFLLRELLWRDDIRLCDMRKKIFWEYVDNYKEKNDEDLSNDMLLDAAISRNFNITYDEFAKILVKPERQKIKIIEKLANAYELELCIYEAINDMDMVFGGDDFLSSERGAREAKRSFKDKLKELKGYPRKKELLGLRLYRLAKEVVPWGKEDSYELREELKFLNECIVKGDTWKTFMAFSKAWNAIDWRKAENLEKNLPRTYEIDDDEADEQEEEKKDIDINQVIINELAQIKATVKEYKVLLYIIGALLFYLFLVITFGK